MHDFYRNFCGRTPHHPSNAIFMTDFANIVRQNHLQFRITSRLTSTSSTRAQMLLHWLTQQGGIYATAARRKRNGGNESQRSVWSPHLASPARLIDTWRRRPACPARVRLPQQHRSAPLPSRGRSRAGGQKWLACMKLPLRVALRDRLRRRNQSRLVVLSLLHVFLCFQGWCPCVLAAIYGLSMHVS